MPKRVSIITKDYLKAAPLPTATSSYTVIPHDYIITNVENELKAAGLEIEKELYKATIDANIASGALLLKQGEDQDMRMLFTWANSYDKTMRFKCAIGGYLPEPNSCIIPANMASWDRKHTGNADAEALDTIKHQISNAGTYYNQLVQDKENMKGITLTKTRAGELLGVIFLEHGLLTSEQMNIIKSEYKKPSFKYSAPVDSLWTFYCHIIYSLQKAHPKTWLDQQRLIHFYLCDGFGIDNAVGIPSASTIAEKEDGNVF